MEYRHFIFDDLCSKNIKAVGTRTGKKYIAGAWGALSNAFSIFIYHSLEKMNFLPKKVYLKKNPHLFAYGGFNISLTRK